MAARWLWLLALCTGPAAAPPPPDAEVTFVLPAGRRECFYQGAPGNASLEAEYQVIGGAGLDVDFSLESPSGLLLVSESRRSDGAHTVEPTEAGDYKLCFDNSFSTISEKLVFFELIFDSTQEDEEEEEEEEEGDGWVEAAEPEDTLDVKIEDIKVGMKFDEAKREVLRLGRYPYWPGMKASEPPHGGGRAGHELATHASSLGIQLPPGWHHRQRGQQGKGGDSAPQVEQEPPRQSCVWIQQRWVDG
ncbi:transmembrane emp24 domain-containing protein 1 isoform X1 [Accipiter gentilis]|uniref:transmembrane emp24 domain-containing protein 1 isoform X1 n=1 Tax=Astur gentilis TaxID=8957 RepID=UPI002110CB0A|nr:transmembrane emp24 domain-containing protein 1 isoform X1 [Accipiter gentilis]